MSTPAPQYSRPDQPPTQAWQQLPPNVQIPGQRLAPPPPAPATKPRTGLKVTLGTIGGLLVGIMIGSAGGSPQTTAAPSVAGSADTQSARSTYRQPPAPAAPVLPAGPVSTFSDGTYEIGPDIVAGKYKTPGPGSDSIVGSCYMEVGDGSGKLGGIVQNDNLTGPGVVTLPKGKVFKASGGCTWTKVG